MGKLLSFDTYLGSAHAMRNELPLSGKVALERPSWHACLL